MRSFIAMMYFCLFIISVSFARYPITWIVAKEEPRNFEFIQEAINNPLVQPGDDIMVNPGTYAENVRIYGSSQINIFASATKPFIDGVFSIEAGNDILIKNFRIYRLEILQGNDITIESCLLHGRVSPYVEALTILSAAGEINATIKNCHINMDGPKIQDGAWVATMNNDIQVHFENNTFENCKRGITADWNMEIHYIDIYMISNNFLGCDFETYTGSPYATWHWSDCEVCPTWFKTPNYPSNYNNNDNVSGVLEPPSNSGYHIVVNGETEYGNDYLYLREMDGTLITLLSGTKSNHKEWINSNRSIKVEFISNSSITYEGYKVTVESPWTTGVSYNVGDIVIYNCNTWINKFAHTSQVDWCRIPRLLHI